jgi:hypothetical protein
MWLPCWKQIECEQTRLKRVEAEEEQLSYHMVSKEEPEQYRYELTRSVKPANVGPCQLLDIGRSEAIGSALAQSSLHAKSGSAR